MSSPVLPNDKVPFKPHLENPVSERPCFPYECGARCDDSLPRLASAHDLSSFRYTTNTSFDAEIVLCNSRVMCQLIETVIFLDGCGAVKPSRKHGWLGEA